MTTPGERGSRTKNHRPPDGLRFVFLGLLAMWLVFPFAVRGNLAQDAVPYVVAGELARSQPDALYPPSRDLYELSPAFASRSCAISPLGTDCANLNVSFVSPPLALPFAILLAQLGPDLAILVFRLIAAFALAGGMLALWHRLAHTTERAPLVMIVTAVVLTPFVVFPIALGQTSPLLFASAAVGVKAERRNAGWAALIALLWMSTVALKVMPIALVLVLLWQRRWKVIAWSVAIGAALVALTAALVPADLYRGFFAAGSTQLQGVLFDDRYNVSWDAAVAALASPDAATLVVSYALRVALVGYLAWRYVRRADDDVQWSWAWAALLLFVPLVWLHYLWVLVAALAIALATALGTRPTLDARWLWSLPALGVLLVALLAVDGQGGIAARAPVAVLVGVVVGIPFLLNLTDRQAFQSD